MPDQITVAGIAGSLRSGSYNRALLRAAAEMAPPSMSIRQLDIAAIPLYNGDVEAAGVPASVVELGAAIDAADALLIATPEYNYSIPGVLKNTIDWLSRLPNKPLDAKPAGIIGASMGPLGTSRAQYHLRQVGVYTNMHILNRPEVLVGAAHEKFDAEGNLTDATTRQYLSAFLETFHRWVERMAR